MRYLQLTFPISEHEFLDVENLLDRSGALSITTSDAEDQPILEPKPGETPLWQNLILTALFPENKNKEKVQNRLKHFLGEARTADLKWELLAEQDWERAWLDDYKPLQFGNTLWVGPHSFTPPNDVKAHLFLDPGLAFGTGTHPTTFLCLEWLSEHDLQNKTLLDFGCGSGILALAALKLGALKVTGVDIDPQAIEASKDNATRNKIPLSQFDLRLFEEIAGIKPVDILIANILANPLIELANTLTAFLKPSGFIVLSGILEEQAVSVKEAYLSSIDWIETKTQDGWVRLVGQVRSGV